MSVRRSPPASLVRRHDSMVAAASRDYTSAFGPAAVPLAPFVYAPTTKESAHAIEMMHTAQAAAALTPQQHPPRNMQSRQRQPRASTAAQLGKGGLDEPTAVVNTKPRPASGPLGIGARPRNLPAQPVSSMQSAQQAWAQVTPPAPHSYLANDMKKPPPQPQPQMRTGPPTPQMQRAPLSNHVSARTKPRAAALASPLTALKQQQKGRPRPSPAMRAAAAAAAANTANDTEKMADTVSVNHILSAAAPLYSILSPAHGSMHAASAASSLPIARPSRPGVFDPFLCMYGNSPDYLVSLPVKRAVVGKLHCKQPGGLLHCLRDRLCYMFFPTPAGANANSPNPQESLQIMMELAWNDVAEVRCTPPAANGACQFSFKIHHHLPAFDSFGDYEPHLRNHRITFDFSTQQELAQFRQTVLPLVLAQAIRR